MNKLKSFFQKHPRAGLLIFLLLAGLVVLPYAYNHTAKVTLAWDQSSQNDQWIQHAWWDSFFVIVFIGLVLQTLEKIIRLDCYER